MSKKAAAAAADTMMIQILRGKMYTPFSPQKTFAGHEFMSLHACNTYEWCAKKVICQERWPDEEEAKSQLV